MNWDSFKTLLSQLRPETIARLVIDLENAHEEWEFYPEQAPPEATRQFLDEAMAVIVSLGDKRAKEEDSEFRRLIERLREEQDQTNWAARRDRQEIDNWLDDYK